MKRKLMITGLLNVLFSLLLSCDSSDQKNNVLPDKLAKIPTGIEVTHSKANIYAIPNEKDPEKYGEYKWHFETSVSSSNEDLKIIEFGAYLWSGQSWIFRTISGRPFNPEEFSKWYSCEGHLMKKGQKYTDHNNWSKSDQLDGKRNRTLWYFIGINDKGQKFKGTAEVVIISELEK